MSVALLVLAAAVLLWPDGRLRRRARVAGEAARERHLAWPTAAPLALLAGCAAAGTGALVGTPLVAALAGCCAGLAVRAAERRRRGAADEARVDALTEALGAFAAELRSGRPLDAAVDAAAAACADVDSGRALAQAVRVPEAVVAPRGAGALEKALERVAAAVLLSVRTGCSLAAVVTAVEDELRARRRLRLELGSATAGPRASATLLAGLPVLALAMGNGVGADPWRVLTTTPTGQVLLVIGVALEVAGLAWSARLVAGAVP